ncbi:MAG: NAD-dependent epimerase/dehydratase family protein [Pirellulaceae bacterium]|nr:NAD-dependent epimerase/dehydratase family protein [Pirellulaceae bacterium]
MATVLVTGYGGFLGQAIVRLLLAAGYAVRGLARSSYPHLVQAGVEPFVGSITDRQAVLAAVEGCDAVIHTAALAGVWGPWEDYYRTNTMGTSHILEAAVRTNCRTIVLTSSPSVTFAAVHQSGIDETTPYPQKWLCHYPHTKALAESAVLRAASTGSVWACSLRPHLIWGKGDPHLMPRVVQRARARQLKRVGTGENLIDIVHVDNAATAHLLALQKLLARDAAVNSQAFFITDGQPLRCWQWISRILDTAGVAIPTGSIGYRTAYRVGALLEALHSICRIRSEPRMTRFVAAQLALDHYFSIDKARRLLGYQPQSLLESAMEECRPWLREMGQSTHKR